MKPIGVIFSVVLLLAGSVFAQDEDGILLGSFILRPDVRALAAYDNRVIERPEAESDLYAETAVGLRINNLPAMYNLSASAGYGYRFYNEYTFSNDDFYNLGVGIGSERDSLAWGISADWRKSLGYNTTYDPESGQEPDDILTDYMNRRLVIRGSVNYDRMITDNSSVRPGYTLSHYKQDGSEDAEWQIHSVGIQLRRKYTEDTVLFAGLAGDLQMNDDEDGMVGSITAGAESQLTDKTSWKAVIGYSYVDYELSGIDHGFISNLRGNWQVTDKIAAYAFAGNDFLPGYNGGAARLVYRVGYGADWQILEKLTMRASMLHDYQDTIGSTVSTDPKIGEVRHFFNTSLRYLLTDRLSGSLGYSYTKDEKTPDKQVLFISAAYQY